MAALYLHHALFAPDTPPPPSVARPSHDRHVSSFSSLTLRTTSEYSHPTEPLLQDEGLNAGSSTYLDLLARQPGHPSEPRASWNTSLSLQPDPITSHERKRLREQSLRRNIGRLRRAKWACLGVIASWAAYNSIRYFVAFSIYPSQDRQAASVALGVSSILSLTLIVLSTTLYFFNLRSHQQRTSPTKTVFVWTVDYASSALLLAPAITNVALTSLWRHSRNPYLAVQGRCHWDIDVVWSGLSSDCPSSRIVLWGYWMAGAIVRLAMTFLVLFLYHSLAYKYNFMAARLTRHEPGLTHSHSVSCPAGRESALSVRSGRSLRTMVSSATMPVSLSRSSISRPGRHPSQSSSDKDSIGEGNAGASSSERRSLRRVASTHISAERLSTDDRRDTQFSRHSQPSSEGHTDILETIDDEYLSLGSLEEAMSGDASDGAFAQFGHQVRHIPGEYAIGSAHQRVEHRADYPTQPVTPLPADNDLHAFVDHFRVYLEQVTQETDAGIELARNDVPGYYTGNLLPSPSESSQAASDEIDYVPIVGSVIRRMPTIESLGSREVMSLASMHLGDRSVHTLSRPPTRANTLSFSDATGSQPPSRSNSLTASVVLASPVDMVPPATSSAG